MADEIERLLVRVEANAVQFENQMRKINKSLYGSQAETRKTLSRIERDTSSASRTMFKPMGDAFKRELAGMAAGLTATLTASQILKYADAWTSASNKLAAAGVASGDLADRQAELVDVANESRTGAQETIALYSRLTIATQEMGSSASETMRLTELMNKAFQSSGSSTQEAASAALQLSQALASGLLQGDELRSLRENAPLLAKAIADAMGVSIGELKKLGSEGKITSSVVMSAILAAGDSIDARFQATQVTVSQALTILNNEIGKFIGQTDASLSATERLAQGIQVFARNLETAKDVVLAAATVIGTTLAARAVGAGIVSFTALRASIAVTNAQLLAFELQSGLAAGAMGRMTVGSAAAAGGMRALGASMSFFGGPIGLTITAVALAVMGLSNAAGTAKRQVAEFDDAMESSNEVLKDALKISEQTAQAAQGLGSSSAGAVSGVNSLAGATAQLASETFRLADAQQEAARTAIWDQIAKNRVAISERQNVDVYTRFGDAMGMTYTRGQYKGRRAKDVREEQIAALEKQNTDLTAAAIQMAVAPGVTWTNAPRSNGSGAGTGDGKKPKGSSGPTPEDLARQRELLGLQNEIELLRAQGNEDSARAKQRELDIINLTKQMGDAGVANAQAAAAAHVGAIAAAEDAARGLGILWENNQKAIEGMEEGNRRSNDLLLDRLGFEAELARLRGDPVAIRTKERELWIEERINTLLAQKAALTRDAARAIAETERGSLDAAGREGENNDRARSMARDFTDVLASDNWAEAAGRKFREAAFDNLEDLLTNLFSGITGGSGAGGNSIGAIIGSALKNMIPGFATGTSSAPGGPAYVHKGEMLVNLKKGTSVVPAHAVRAMGALAGRSQVQPRAAAQTPVVRIYMDEGGLFAPRVQQLSGRVAVQTTAAGVAYAQDQTQQSARRQRQRLV